MIGDIFPVYSVLLVISYAYSSKCSGCSVFYYVRPEILIFSRELDILDFHIWHFSIGDMLSKWRKCFFEADDTNKATKSFPLEVLYVETEEQELLVLMKIAWWFGKKNPTC